MRCRVPGLSTSRKESSSRLEDRSAAYRVRTHGYLIMQSLTAYCNSSWMYVLFLMLDANFRLKSKARGLNDIELTSGWAYFVEESKYMAHIDSFGKETEVS